MRKAVLSTHTRPERASKWVKGLPPKMCSGLHKVLYYKGRFFSENTLWNLRVVMERGKSLFGSVRVLCVRMCLTWPRPRWPKAQPASVPTADQLACASAGVDSQIPQYANKSNNLGTSLGTASLVFF